MLITHLTTLLAIMLIRKVYASYVALDDLSKIVSRALP